MLLFVGAEPLTLNSQKGAALSLGLPVKGPEEDPAAKVQTSPIITDGFFIRNEGLSLKAKLYLTRITAVKDCLITIRIAVCPLSVDNGPGFIETVDIGSPPPGSCPLLMATPDPKIAVSQGEEGLLGRKGLWRKLLLQDYPGINIK